MKEYYVEDRGLRWSFNYKENAEKKSVEVGSKVYEEEFWKYFAPFYTAGTSEYRKIKGENLIDAIESNFHLIMKDNGLIGLSGYKLFGAELTRDNKDVVLVIDSQKLQKLGAPGERKISKIKIEGVHESDFGSKYVFDIISK